MAFLNTNQHQLATPDTPIFSADSTAEASTPLSYANHSTTWTPTDRLTPSLTTNPSRKRSRDESAFEVDGESSYFSHPTIAVSTPAPIPEEKEPEPIYGEGMVLLNPTTGRALSAESQTGTWYEESAAKEAEDVARQRLLAEAAAEEAATQFRPKMPVSRKSIRMSQSSIRADVDSNILSLVPQSHSNIPASPPKSASDRLEIDEATIALGIGWTKIASDDPDLQAAARGWAKYIDNHYHEVREAEILLKSRSLNAFLVKSSNGYFLFSEDLLEGKLVGTTWETALQNLKTGQFEGSESIRAERTPGPEDKRDGLLGFQQAQPPPILASGTSHTTGMDLD